MKISNTNGNGVVESSEREIVATHGRSFASIEFALCEDGFIRCSVHFQYSHGGYGEPIIVDGERYTTKTDARTAGLEKLLRCWRKPFPSEPQCVHNELRLLREQIEACLHQPILL